MCAFCGSFSEKRHWSGALAGARAAACRAELAKAVTEVAALAGVGVSAWGTRFVVRGPTGRVAVAADLADVWRLCDRVGQAIDPLDAKLLEKLDRAARS